jgi:hypothetical protein
MPFVLDECAIEIEVVTDTGDGQVFFSWANQQDGANYLSFLTVGAGTPLVHMKPDGGPVESLTLQDSSTFTTGRIRMSEAGGTYLIETKAPSQAWVTRATIGPAQAPSWLAELGYVYFGVQGGASDAEFDNFNVP